MYKVSTSLAVNWLYYAKMERTCVFTSKVKDAFAVIRELGLEPFQEGWIAGYIDRGERYIYFLSRDLELSIYYL